MNKETIIQINMLAKKFNFLWITGNHDYNLEKSRIYGEIKKQFMMKNLIFKHIFTKLIKKKKNLNFLDIFIQNFLKNITVFIIIINVLF